MLQSFAQDQKIFQKSFQQVHLQHLLWHFIQILLVESLIRLISVLWIRLWLIFKNKTICNKCKNFKFLHIFLRVFSTSYRKVLGVIFELLWERGQKLKQVKKICKSIFQVRISVQKVIFLHGCMQGPRWWGCWGCYSTPNFLGDEKTKTN